MYKIQVPKQPSVVFAETMHVNFQLFICTGRIQHTYTIHFVYLNEIQCNIADVSFLLVFQSGHL